MLNLFQKPDFMIPPEGIDSVERVTLGGIQQTILIQSTAMNLPVLLFLHGGPSMPLPGVSSRGKNYTVATNTKELVKHFTLVFWDQRGTGKSYHKNIPQETMNFEQFVQDANEMTDFLLKRFNQQKIYLAAHSYGSLIGMYLIHHHPQKFYSYTGISQLISWTENDKLSLQWLKTEAAARHDKKALKELNAVGVPPFLEGQKQWGVLRKWQMKYNSMVYTDKNIKHPGLAKISLNMLLSKDYRLSDMKHTFYDGFKLVYSDEFIRNIPLINVAKDIPRIGIPVTFIHGKHDVHVHGELLEDYVENLNAEHGKRIVWCDKSAHLFHPDDTKDIENLLIQELNHSQ
ncbi:alpha/beta fold hydrolase [Bacillus sp. AK031]